MVAGEIAHPDLLDAVARRTFDANDGVRTVALEALRHYTRLPQFDAVLRAICDLSARPARIRGVNALRSRRWLSCATCALCAP